MPQTETLQLALVEIGLILLAYCLIGFAAFEQKTRLQFSLCAFTIVAMGNGTVRWVAVLSLLGTAYFVFLDASGGQGPFATQSPAENILAATISDHHRATVDVAGGADAGATRERNRRARE
jgi:hypothetical protein